jgi:hypothetical protein
LLIADIEYAEKQRFDDSSWKNISLPYAWNGDEIIDQVTARTGFRKVDAYCSMETGC